MRSAKRMRRDRPAVPDQCPGRRQYRLAARLPLLRIFPMRKPFAALALALAVATAGVAAWAGNVSRPLGVPIASHDGTVITLLGGSQPTTAAALGEIITTEGTWTFGTPGDANGDYPLLLNGSAAGGGLAAVSAQ